MAEPLLSLLRDHIPFIWSSTCEQAFHDLKQALTTAPVLAYPNFSRPFLLSTYAYQVAIGAVLEQVDTMNYRHPIAYFSRTLNTTQRKYSVSEKECLALVESIRHFRQFLTLGHFLVYTDHKALQALTNPKSKVAEGRLQRWQLFLQSFDFTIYHRPGSHNVVADTLSRIPDSSTSLPISFPVAKSIKAFCIGAIPVDKERSFIQRLRTAQHQDIELIPLIIFLKEGTLPSDSALSRKVMAAASSHSLRNGILMHRAFSSGTSSEPFRIVVPHGMKKELVSYFHVPPLTGAHLGAPRFFQKLLHRFYWPTMYRDVKIFVRACPECQEANSPRVPHAGAPLHATPTPDLFEHVALDFVGPLPTSLHRNRYILVLTDVFSRWVEAYPLPDQTAEATAVCLADWTTRYGSPLILSSDMGTSFLNATIEAFCRIWHIQQQFTSAYHHQANGLVERFNATLCDMLRAYSVDTGQLWDETMNAVLFAYRTSFHFGTNTSPDLLVYGQSLRVPLDVELHHYLRERDLSPTDPSFIFSHAQALARAREQARLYMDRYKAKYEAQYNSRRRTVTFNVGDLVWMQTPQRNNKLSPKWSGPFRIYGRPSENAYLLHTSNGEVLPSPVSVEHLKLAHFDLSAIDHSSFDVPPVSSPSESYSSSSSSINPSVTNSLALSSPLPYPEVVREFQLPATNSSFSEHEYDVERILGKRIKKRRLQYLVKWIGYPQPTWEPVSGLTNCQQAIADFESTQIIPSPHSKRDLHFQAPFAHALPTVIPSSQDEPVSAVPSSSVITSSSSTVLSSSSTALSSSSGTSSLPASFPSLPPIPTSITSSSSSVSDIAFSSLSSSTSTSSSSPSSTSSRYFTRSHGTTNHMAILLPPLNRDLRRLNAPAYYVPWNRGMKQIMEFHVMHGIP